MSEVKTELTPNVEERATRECSMRELRHDLRHSLYVLGLATELLEDSRADDDKFSEVLQMVRKERATMEKLVDRLSQFVIESQSRAD